MKKKKRGQQREISEEGGRVSAYLQGLPGWDASTWVEAVERATAGIFTPPGEGVRIFGWVQNVKASVVQSSDSIYVVDRETWEKQIPLRFYLTDGTKAMLSNPMTLVSASRRPVNSGLLLNLLMKSESSR